jgi:hypothetical protein
MIIAKLQIEVENVIKIAEVEHLAGRRSCRLCGRVEGLGVVAVAVVGTAEVRKGQPCSLAVAVANIGCQCFDNMNLRI